MNKYITTQSGEGKIERILSNLSRIEAGVGGLPQKFRNTEEKQRRVRSILATIAELERMITALKETE
jgi:hypothetical protein